MLSNNTITKSAFEQIRETPLEDASMIWSSGKTIREYPGEEDAPLPVWQNETYRQAHAKHCAALPGQCWVDKEELAFLLRTSEHVARQYDDEGILDVSTPIETHERTIDQELRAQGMSSIDLDRGFTTPDGRTEFDLADRHLSVTPYERPSPLTVKRIEWERRTRLSGPVIRTRIKERNGSAVVSISGVELTDEERIARSKDYLRGLIAQRGTLPSLDDIRAWHRKVKEAPTLSQMVPYADEDWRLSTYHEEDDDPQRVALARALTQEEYEAEEQRLIAQGKAPQGGSMAAVGLDLGPRGVTATSEWELGQELDVDPYSPNAVDMMEGAM
jgi:hypothetical protein